MLLLAALFRFHAIGAASYWTDEFFSLQTSNGIPLSGLTAGMKTLREPVPRLTARDAAQPWPRVIEALRFDNHPPLYFLGLRFWRRLADGESGTRALSALFSLAGLALAWGIVRRRAGALPALACAALLAVSAQQIRYAQETRGYAMAMAFVTLSLLAVDRLEAGRSLRAWAALLGASALAAMLTHYYAAGALAGLAAYAALGLDGARRRAALAGFAAAGVAFAALWGPTLLEQRAYVARNNAWVLAPEAEHGLATLARLSAWPAAVLADVRSGDVGSAWTAGALGWVALALASRVRANRLWISVVAGAVLPVLAVDVLLGGRQLEIARYTLFAAPALAAALATLPGRLARLVPAVVLLALVVGLPQAWRADRPPWREFARLVSGVARPHEAVVVVGPLDNVDADPMWAYQALVHYAWAPDRPFAFVRGRPSPALRVALRRAGSAWIVAPPDGDLSGYAPFQLEDQLEYSSEMPLLRRVSFPRDLERP